MPRTPLPKHLRLPQRTYGGYFAYPLIEEDLEDADFEQWHVLAEFVEEAKRGNFHKLAPLLSLHRASRHWVIPGAMADLLGDAGTDALIEEIYHYLLSGVPVSNYARDLAMILTKWGRLDIIPMLIEAWRLTSEFDGAPILSLRMALMLREEGEPLSVRIRRGAGQRAREARAATLVDDLLARHAKLTKQFGERAFVFRGHLLDVEWIARQALADLTGRGARSRFRISNMRRKFETMTGIDCSCFYKDGILQPLAAAAVLEAFLTSPECKRFVPGQRYFFGHPIPYGDPAGAADWPPRGE